MKKYVMPVGKSDFEKIIEDRNYYVDKTDLIRQIITEGAEVTLFTRPRRFGKTLNMSMLENFFDIRKDSKAIFEGLAISKNAELCDKWMNQHPTILISFKEVGGLDFEKAVSRLRNILYKLYDDHKYLIKDDGCAEEYEIEKFKTFLNESNSSDDLTDSLTFLSKLMYDYYQKPVIILIDEYDVPMSKGSVEGYYREITDIIRYMLSKALKDNPYLKLAVMTGCLRIAKESIFTGLNNLYVNTISDIRFDECFGFTEPEVDQLLADTGLTTYKPIIKDWYNGYRFGSKDIYCPWDVLNYVSDLQGTAGLAPKNYWSNTSSNDIIRQYLESNLNLNAQIEALLRGESITTDLSDDVTYHELTNSAVNFWSILYATGYLTIVPDDKPFDITKVYKSGEPFELPKPRLRLVNYEVKDLFAKTIAKWFTETVVKDDRTALFEAIWNGDTAGIASNVGRYLRTTISYYDYSENFYHAFLAGLLSGVKGISVESNKEYGEGRADIIVKNEYSSKAAVLELKIAGNISDVPSKCDEALEQIDDKRYVQPLIEEEGFDVIKYGVVFFKKRCFVKKA